MIGKLGQDQSLRKRSLRVRINKDACLLTKTSGSDDLDCLDVQVLWVAVIWRLVLHLAWFSSVHFLSVLLMVNKSHRELGLAPECLWMLHTLHIIICALILLLRVWLCWTLRLHALEIIVNLIIKKLINNIQCELILFSQHPAQIRSNILSF